MHFSTEYLLDTLSSLAVLLGPLPLGLVVAKRSQPASGEEKLAFQTAAILSTWCVTQSGIAVATGSAGLLRLFYVVGAEALVAAVGLVLLFRSPETRSGAISGRGRKPRSTAEILSAGLVCLTGIYLLWQVVTVPVTEYDSLMYHLPATARFYRSGTLQIPEQFSATQIGYYPYSWEATGTLMVLPLREDLFVLLPNLVAAALLGISIYLLATQAGAGRSASLACAGIVITYPITIATIGSAHVDLPLATFFAASLAFSKAYARSRNPWCLFLAVSMAGMMAGAKTSGLIYLVLAALGAIWFLATTRSETSQIYSGIRSAAIASLIGLIASGWWYWYVRNWINVGNPLGLVPVRLAGVTILPGSMDVSEVSQTTLAHLFSFSNLSHVKIFARAVNRELGLGFIALTLVVPLALVVLCVRPKWINRDTLFYIALSAGTALVYWFTPYSADNGSHDWQITPWIGQGIRYAFPLLTSLAVSAAILATTVRMPAALLVALLLANCTLLLIHETEFVYLYATCLAGVGVLANQLRSVSIGRWFQRFALAGTMAGFIAFLLLTPMLSSRRDAQRADKYDGLVHFIDENTQPGDAVGYIASHKSYLFAGKRLDRAPLYCPPEPAQEPGTWAQSLRERGIVLIAAGPVVFGFENERALGWLAHRRDLFIPVFGSDLQSQVMVYRLADNRIVK